MSALVSMIAQGGSNKQHRASLETPLNFLKYIAQKKGNEWRDLLKPVQSQVEILHIWLKLF